MSKSAVVLTLFIGWALLLLVLMEILRSYLVLTGRNKSNEFKPDNSNVSPFMHSSAARKRLGSMWTNCFVSFRATRSARCVSTQCL